MAAAQAQAQLDCSESSTGDAAALIEVADCYETARQPVRALDVLGRALAAAEGVAGAEPQVVASHARSARILASLGEYPAALEHLLTGIDLVAARLAPAAAAPLLNELGGVYVATGETLQSVAAFADSYRLAESPPLRVTSGINLIRALADAGFVAPLRAELARLDRPTLALDDSVAKARALLALASLHRQLESQPVSRARELAVAALELARKLGDDTLTAFADLELGEWHFARGNAGDALSLARSATLAAQAGGATDALYRAEWLSARILRALDRPTEARAAYRAAVASLAASQGALVTSERTFQADVLPLYTEYADVMLASAPSLPAEPRRRLLVEVQETLERLRLAEVLNYFQNECAVPEVFDLAQGREGSVLVVYPAVFEDRTEFLVRSGADLAQFTVPVGHAELAAEVKLLRTALEDAGSGEAYLAPAQRLYGWLIEPLEGVIESAAPEVLVFVPAGPLRTVPLGVLHDGRQFLVERLPIATTPGMALVSSADSAPINRVLASGISASVRGFPALPFVATELESVARTFPSAVYVDETFVSDTLEREVLRGGYAVVHLATHAQFESDYERSFLLAYDGLITMDQLEEVVGSQRFAAQPVDLLVLSACQTAAGDERAALGLAGVAVKAGARSALASLWRINDESTAALIAEFYRQLAGGSGKAAALRGAQLRLINDERYGHPAHWASFLMIGDWR